MKKESVILLIKWVVLLFLQVVLIGFSWSAFSVLKSRSETFQEATNANFKLQEIFSLETNQMTIPKNGDHVIAAFSDFLEGHLLNHLYYRKRTFQRECQATWTFDQQQIKQCIIDMCSKYNNQACTRFIQSNYTTASAILLNNFDCTADFYNVLNDKQRAPIHMKIHNESMIFTSNVIEAKRLLTIYKNPLLLSVDRFTVKPLTDDNTLEDYSKLREDSLTQGGMYISSPTLLSTEEVINVNCVGWNDESEGFMLKDIHGFTFGQSHEYLEGKRSSNSDNTICGRDSMKHWLPCDDGDGIKQTVLYVNETKRKEYGIETLNSTRRYCLQQVDGKISIVPTNAEFDMYDITVIDIDSKKKVKISDYTTVMIESLLYSKEEIDLNSTVHCGYSFMSYSVLRKYLEMHKNGDGNPIVCNVHVCVPIY